MIKDYSEATVQLTPLAQKIEVACQDMRWADAFALSIEMLGYVTGLITHLFLRKQESNYGVHRVGK